MPSHQISVKLTDAQDDINLDRSSDSARIISAMVLRDPSCHCLSARQDSQRPLLCTLQPRMDVME